MKLNLILISLLFVLAPVAYAQSNTADKIGAALHPVYISLAYTCVPALNEISSFCSALGSICLSLLCPCAILFFFFSGFIKMLTLPVIYGCPLLYSFLGLMGGNPNFFIGGIGDLLGHLFVDAGSSLSSLILCLPLGSCFITFGDLITLCGNGLSVLVVGDLFTALQQFFGAFMLSFITMISIMNLCLCSTVVGTPCSYICASALGLCTNLVALATDLLGQVITYCRPVLAALLH